MSREDGNRKNDPKMWGAFLKEDSLLKNDFSEDYFLKYTPFYRICELFSTGRSSRERDCGLHLQSVENSLPKV